MSIKKIFTKKVAMELIKKGYDLIDMETNLKHKNLKVYVFKKTDGLMQELTNITRELNK